MEFVRQCGPILLLMTVFLGSTEAQTTCNTDLCFLVDESGSICETDPNFNIDRDNTCGNWNTMLQFIANVTDALVIGPNDIRVAMVTFGSSAELRWNLNGFSDKASLHQAIVNIAYTKAQETYTNLGLNIMKNQVFTTARLNINKVSIILTDGKPTDVSAAQSAANDVQNSGIKCYAVGVTSSIDESILRDLSSQPRQENVNYFKATDFNSLREIVFNVQGTVCATAATRDSPSPPSAASGATGSTVSAGPIGGTGASGPTVYTSASGGTGSSGVTDQNGAAVSTGTSRISDSSDNNAAKSAAIALGVLFGISLLVIAVLAIMLYRKTTQKADKPQHASLNNGHEGIPRSSPIATYQGLSPMSNRGPSHDYTHLTQDTLSSANNTDDISANTAYLDVHPQEVL